MHTKPPTTSTPRRRSPLRRPLRRLLRIAYACYALGLFAALLTVATLLALVLPVLAWRRSVTRWVARTWLRAAGVRIETSGLGSLPDGSCVLVANHCSYIDGVVMKAALPPRFSFVIKREASSMPVIGFLLRRIGSEFVDRHSPGGRQRDARRVMKRAETGHSLVFFPEGTFDEQPGLKRFHVGAFAAAARGNVPLVPSVIHGARRVLPSETIVPRPGRIRVEILPPIDGDGDSADALREHARAVMLARLTEPDLGSRDDRVPVG